MTFPVSGVETEIWVPPLVAFVSPAVSPTNLVFNIVATPSGILRYMREGRMVWPLTWIVIIGTVPGVFLGGWIRLRYLPDPGPFKAFVGCVLLYIGVQLLRDILRRPRSARPGEAAAATTAETADADWVVNDLEFTPRRLAFRFRGSRYACSTLGVSLFSLVVGLIGGIYGVGGGAIIAPIFVALYGLPVYVVAGATLMGTLVTSVAGVLFFQFVGPLLVAGGVTVAPDWLLGALFGVGGMAGMYLGARVQRFVPATAIKIVLCLVIFTVVVRYLVAYFLA